MQTHRNPSAQNPVKPQKPEEYEFSKKNYLQGTQMFRERPGRKYIYVIFHHGSGSYPFYVGQAGDLASRFTRHDERTWHYAQFQRKAIVHIIASVPEEYATEVEKKAIEVLSKTGFILNNSSMNKTSLKRLRDMSWTEIDAYRKFTNTITAYEAIPRIQSYARKLENNKASKKALDEQESGVMTSAKLYRVVAKRIYGSNQSRSLAHMLAKEYDSITQTSSHVFPKNPNLTEKAQIELILSAVKGLRGDWSLRNEDIVLDKQTVFVLSPDLENATPKKLTYGRSIKVPATRKEISQAEESSTEPVYFTPSTASTLESDLLENPPAEVVQKIIVTRSYKTNYAVLAAQKLSKTYDPNTGTATYSFRGSANLRKKEQLLQSAKEAIHLISGDWTLLSPLELQKDLEFALTDNVKRYYKLKSASAKN